MLVNHDPAPLSCHVRQVPLHIITLQSEDLDRLQEELITVPLSQTLDREYEVVSYPTQLDLALELLMP